ncbi:MAG: hypothetical protein OXH75_11140 [Acidobacteria bacterium]|nr:hypothetical protein [Acidobacteriota bacterium]
MRAILTQATVALAGLLSAGAGCVATDNATPGDTGTSRHAPFAGADRPLVNEDWQVLRMATAHGVMTIEIELGDIERSLEVARTLVEPLTADYAEVLVYVYADGQGTGGHAPARRVQWTGRDGYVEIAYE